MTFQYLLLFEMLPIYETYLQLQNTERKQRERERERIITIGLLQTMIMGLEIFLIFITYKCKLLMLLKVDEN